MQTWSRKTCPYAGPDIENLFETLLTFQDEEQNFTQTYLAKRAIFHDIFLPKEIYNSSEYLFVTSGTIIFLLRTTGGTKIKFMLSSLCHKERYEQVGIAKQKQKPGHNYAIFYRRKEACFAVWQF